MAPLPRLNEEFFWSRPACPVCGNTETSQIYCCGLTETPVKDFLASHYERQGTLDWSLLAGTDFVLCECAECAIVYQRNVPNDQVLDSLYNSAISPDFLKKIEDERLSVDNFNRVAGEMDRLFRLTGRQPSEIRFLDFGFGRGRWARVARAMGATVFATETGEEKKALASAIGVEIIEDEDIDRMRFDIVHTEQVFEHLVDPAQHFRRLAAVTDGIMKVAVPQHGNIRRHLEAHGMASRSPFNDRLQGKRLTNSEDIYVAIQPLEHLNAYAAKTIDRLALDNDMRVISRSRRASVAVNIDSWSLLAKSVERLGTMLAKAAFARAAFAGDNGYYLLAPRARQQ